MAVGSVCRKLEQPQLDYAAFKEEQYNKLADHVRKHLNMPLLYQILTQMINGHGDDAYRYTAIRANFQFECVPPGEP